METFPVIYLFANSFTIQIKLLHSLYEHFVLHNKSIKHNTLGTAYRLVFPLDYSELFI